MTSKAADARRAYETPVVPVSWGELVDKITILEIKHARIHAPVALGNIGRELRQLLAIAGQNITRDPEIGELRQALKLINESLWDVEDNIRELEAKRQFDQAFIDLARSVYKLNDERARTKQRINSCTASELVEEKSYSAF